MLRGTSLFICDDCKTIFMGLNIEWNCLPVSATQQCIKCGGWHTMPGRHLDSPDRNSMSLCGSERMKPVIIILLVRTVLMNWKNI